MLKKELSEIIKANNSPEIVLASLRQTSCTVSFEIAERFSHSRIDELTQKLPEMDNLVLMATEIDQRALHDFLLLKYKEQSIELIKGLKFKGKTPKILKLNHHSNFSSSDRLIWKFSFNQYRYAHHNIYRY